MSGALASFLGLSSVGSQPASEKGRGGNDHRAKSWVMAGNTTPGATKGVIMRNSNTRSARGKLFQSRRDRNMPRNGNFLPSPREQFAADDVAKAQGEVLQGVFGNLKSPAKEMARVTGDSERACRNQLAGLNSMQLHKFFKACQSIPEIQAWGAMMMGMDPADPRFQQEMAKGTREIVLRIDAGGLTLGKGGD